MKQLIYFTTFEMGWLTKWQVLKLYGKPFTNINDAINFVRNNKPNHYIGLATTQQMKLQNAQWDNF